MNAELGVLHVFWSRLAGEIQPMVRASTPEGWGYTFVQETQISESPGDFRGKTKGLEQSAWRS